MSLKPRSWRVLIALSISVALVFSILCGRPTSETAPISTAGGASVAITPVTSGSGGHTITLSYSGTANTLANDGTSTYSHDPADALFAVGSATAGAQTPLLAWTDQHDDVVGQFSAAATALTRSVSYDPWGTLTTGNTLTGALGFQSGWTDPGSGRVNMLSRWYDPAEGQFTSRDRVGLSPVPNAISANRYAYVNDNPMGGTDPSGECSWWDVVCGASSAWHAATHVVSRAWTAATHFVSHAWHAVKQVAHHVYDGARKIVHHVVKAATHVVHHVVHAVVDGYHKVKQAAEHVWHHVKQAASTVYHAAKHVVDSAVHAVSTVVDKTIGAARTAVTNAGNAISAAGAWVKQKAGQAGTAIGQAATASVNFVSKHAATITGFVVSTVVFAGCEAAITAGSAGTLSVPGAMACGALAGAAGSMAETAVRAAQDGKQVTLGDMLGAAVTGGASGAIGGAGGVLLGRAVSAVGAKLAGPISKLLGRATETGESAAANTVSEGSGSAGKLACPLGHSFTPDTKVLLASGATAAISTLKVGDKVRSVDPATGNTHARKVTKVHVNHDNDLLDLVVVRNGKRSTLHTTASHPFWSESRHDWVRAEQLGVGDQLASANAGGPVKVARLAATEGDQDRWDLTVQTDHDYYVLAGLVPVLVHNCGVVASDGTAVTGFTKHGVDRVIGDGGMRAGVRPEALLDAIKNPVRITEGVDSLDRPFKIFTGKDARLVMNPESGRVVSVNPRSGAGANR